ncbi:ribonuclease H family protein [Paludibacter sp.]
MVKSKNNYYVVWDGVKPGIYKSWDECKLQIHGYVDAKYKGFKTLEEAQKTFNSNYRDYIGKTAIPPTKENKLLFGEYEKPILESLSVDAACSGNPGLVEYRGVYTKTGEEVFRQGPFKNGTNNIGEFLALVHGIAYLKQKNIPMPIYTDSKTAIAWVKKKKAKTELERNEQNDILFNLIERAEKWLRENEYSTQVIKWNTEAWGEIPADFGRK